MELGSQDHNRDGLLGHNSIMVVYMDPLGIKVSLKAFEDVLAAVDARRWVWRGECGFPRRGTG